MLPGAWARRTASIAATVVLVLALAGGASAAVVQQGSKLVPNDEAAGGAGFGNAVAVSADGNTALIAGGADNSGNGAVWVFVRSSGAWIQQGAKLPGTGGGYGQCVALSGDGNTAIVGAPNTSVSAGAAWIYTRSNGSWTLQKTLPGTGNIRFGCGVALSGDGNLALIGAPDYNSGVGEVYVYQRSGGAWSPMLGTPLTPTDNIGNSSFGSSVALSPDGTTAVIGGSGDNNTGGAWIYTRSNTTWTEQKKLPLPSDASSGDPAFGSSAGVSSDGNTALIGAMSDNGGIGAAWVFTRSGTTWSQQGGKLAGADATSGANFGVSAGLSADGNTAVIGGSGDAGQTGATWIFTRSGATWSQSGSKLVGSGFQGFAGQGSGVAVSADGATLLTGGPYDHTSSGAAWVFVQPPSCSDTQARTPAGGGGIQLTLPCAGPPGVSLGYSIVQQPAHGTLSAVSPAGSVTYTSGPDFAGTDTFTYRVTDVDGLSNTATATITVPPAPPSCGDVAVTAPAGGGAVTVPLSCTAPAGAAITYAIAGQPAHGTLSAVDQSRGSVVYLPAAAFNGTDSFRYQATNSGGTSSAATVTVTVPPAPPSCSNIVRTGRIGVRTVAVRLSCTGPAGVSLTYRIVRGPAHGVVGGFDASTGRFTYRARGAYTGSDQVTYTATDGGGSSGNATATITIPAGRFKPEPSLLFAFRTTATSSTVASMVVFDVPRRGLVTVTCTGGGCTRRSVKAGAAAARRCSSKRKCTKRSTPGTRTVDLTRLLRGWHLRKGARLTIEVAQVGYVGKAWVFAIRPPRAPSTTVTCLAPGSTAPGRGC